MVQDGGGELADPLLGRAADPAAVLAPGGGERFGCDAAAEVVDADGLPGECLVGGAPATSPDRTSSPEAASTPELPGDRLRHILAGRRDHVRLNAVVLPARRMRRVAWLGRTCGARRR